ncbi:hypothetical protein GLI01_16600 [Gluconacetobacter liquefaciens]|uniref:DDE family transposase n=1 Tax=Gluconacetobacter liquefaciens TaxID=89584 RepID=A0A370G992_GLULI|nr:hypothetical protein [Gluconacetobacter liquefaciens]RDI39780.1 hypothetical protein C7453_102576 [Gluconacetobacter liquefaciens]GBR12844.1 hypothetical protein AA0522_2566 [Gluconacetobacter liquefaciens NRIC 0522]GEB37625.1 hypothetical protein GLI01_16600 [Gluconacetobacter liquefaciens]
MVPGNTAESRALMAVVTRRRERFGITRTCVVANRGMISTANVRALEDKGLEYILGTRKRTTRAISDVVLTSDAPMTPLILERLQD